MYTIYFSHDDLSTIAIVGNRYGWSRALGDIVHHGLNHITEPDSWALVEAFEDDKLGGHDFFPMLGNSVLRDKLSSFVESIV